MKSLSLLAAASLLTSCAGDRIQINNYGGPSVPMVRTHTREHVSGILIGPGLETRVYGEPVEVVRDTQVIYVQ